jgi:hypothetical protein
MIFMLLDFFTKMYKCASQIFWKLQVLEVQRLLFVFHELFPLILGKILSLAFEGEIKSFLRQLIPSEQHFQDGSFSFNWR